MMKCRNCKEIIPDDSDFCPFCGCKTDWPDDAVMEEKSSADNLTKEKYAFRYDEITNDAPAALKKTKGKKISIALIVLILALIGLNVFQYMQSIAQRESMEALEQSLSDSKKTLEEKEQQLKEAEKKVDSANREKNALTGKYKTLESKMKTLESQNDQYERDGLFFKKLIKELDCDNLGYASSNFRASDSVIILSTKDKPYKFTLTAHWTNGGTVSYQHRDSLGRFVVNISFDSDEWQTSTKVTVKPQSIGVTRVTFSNSVNNDKFNIVFVVTD